MRILLIRHGEAVDIGARSDGERWLTPHGRQTTRRVAAWLAGNSPPATVLTSPLVRAAQTAEIVLGACGVDHAEVLRELATGDLRALLTFVRGFRGAGPLCLVGHEPTLGELVAQLLGRIDAPEFPKSAVFAIDLDDDGAGRFAWRLRPRDLTTHSTL